jgi:SAM-dependent methyltransferase
MKDPGSPVHSLSKKEIYDKSLDLRNQGLLYDIQDPELDDLFRGSIDRFCEISSRLSGARKVLDVGAGHGMLLSLLSELGHKCYGVDLYDCSSKYPGIYQKKSIPFQVCNLEIDPLPFNDEYFDAVVCCQVLEHFTHSHLHLMREIHRVLKQGGLVEVDVPNAVCFRNRSRMLRGKHITFDYEEHYLYARPVLYRSFSFYPDRHNREFTLKELVILLKAAKFNRIEAYYLKSRRHREGWERLRSLGSALRDSVPSLRKSIIAFAEK